MGRQTQTDDARKICDAEVFDVDSDTDIYAKQKAKEQHDSDRTRCEIINRYDDGYVVMVYDAAQID